MDCVHEGPKMGLKEVANTKITMTIQTYLANTLYFLKHLVVNNINSGITRMIKFTSNQYLQSLPTFNPRHCNIELSMRKH